MILELAQLQIHERKDTCESSNGFCPGWIADHFGDYVHPFFQHLFLTVITVAIGFAISFTLALIAYRRRWLINPVTQVTGILYTIPSLSFFFLLLPITGRGNTTAIIVILRAPRWRRARARRRASACGSPRRSARRRARRRRR